MRINPIILFASIILFSLAIFTGCPEDWLNEWYVKNLTPISTLTGVMLLAFVCFTMGSGAAFYFSKPSPDFYRETSRNYLKTLQVCTFVSGIALLIVLIMTINYRGVSGLVANMKGAGKPYYIPGVTTFVHLTTAGLLVFSAVRLKSYEWYKVQTKGAFNIFAALIFTIALIRGIFGAERLAILIPSVGIGVIYIINRVILYRKMVLLLIIAIAFVTVSFIILETVRSYSIKYDYGTVTDDPITYGIKRLVLYYVLAINTGGARLEFMNEGLMISPLFVQTANPFARFYYDMTSMGSVSDLNYAEFEAMGVAAGVYNQEFTNVSGLLAPFTEGWFIGMGYWMFWGYVATYYYQRAYSLRGTGYDIAIYSLIVAAILDTPRVSLLGATHFLFPFIFLIIFKIIGPTQYMIIKRLVSAKGKASNTA